MLVAVHRNPLMPTAPGLGWTAMEERAEEVVRQLRDAVAPDARTAVETNRSVRRALEQVVRREHRDLLVVGSSPKAPDGRLRIDDTTRQLLDDAPCALAVAPRGFASRTPRPLTSIGVGYDDTPEARAAVRRAGELALAARARLRVRAVVDDRLPTVGWPGEDRAVVGEMWDRVLAPEVEPLRERAARAACATGADFELDVTFGPPGDGLIELCGEVDLLLLGSGRWGTVARVLRDSTGEALMGNASCPVMFVPRARATHDPPPR